MDESLVLGVEFEPAWRRPACACKSWRLYLHSRYGLRWALWDVSWGILALMVAAAVPPHGEVADTFHLWFLFENAIPFGLLLGFFSRHCAVPIPGQDTQSGRYEVLASGFLAMVVSVAAYMAFAYVVHFHVHGRLVIGYVGLFSWLGLCGPRLLISRFICQEPMKVLILGAGRLGQSCSRFLKGCSNFEVLGFLDDAPDMLGRQVEGGEVVGSLSSFSDRNLVNMGVDLVVLCVKSDLKPESAERLVKMPLNGIEVLSKGAFFERYLQQEAIGYANAHYLTSFPSQPANEPLLALKRVGDLLGASVGLLVTGWLWPLLALAIKLDSPGPVFYRQTRVGYRGRHFEIIKFRTMRQDAEKDGAQWASAGDRRVTRLGKLMRATRLDELPQFLNVIRGEMSLVGPRPERPEFVKEFVEDIPFYERREMVPPGLTGWAQIKYRYGASKEDAARKLRYDLYYVRHLSPALDLQILIKTVCMVMKGSR